MKEQSRTRSLKSARSARRFRRASTSVIAFVATIGTVVATVAHAQENSALIDALVRKGVLTNKEADEVRGELSRDAAAASSGKIKLTNSITELKLYGDLRLRYQYENKDPQANPPGVGVDNGREDRSPTGNQLSRWRFRLRLNADFKLGRNVFGGVELQTNSASDSGFQTYENGFADYPIFISRAYLGWTPADWLTVTAGKGPNPFYSTDMVWDPDINPTGLTELVQFHKLFAAHEAEGGFSKDGGYSKDGKSVAPKPAESRWELSLVAGQFIFDDNVEGGGSDVTGAATDNDATTDAYLFETQLIGAYKFNKTTKLTIAPGWLTYVNGSLAGVDNANSFNDNGVVSGATRNLSLLLLPGDLAFNLGSLKAKLLWDFSYNIEGRKRAEDIYNLAFLRAPGDDGVADSDDLIKRHNNRDDFAWLVGIQLGENKKKGDWSVVANYREVGIAAVDPNINESDFALSELNVRGFRIGAAYNLTDFAVASFTYNYAWNLRGDLVGGEATGGNAIADSNEITVLQVDINVKF